MRLTELRFGTCHEVSGPQPGQRHFGVPPGGAFDALSHAAANCLVGKPEDAPVLELANAHATFTTDEDTHVALVGAVAQVTVDDQPTATNRSLRLRAGQVLTVRPPSLGARVYLAAGTGHQRTIEIPPNVRYRDQVAVHIHRPDLLPPDWPGQILRVSGQMSRMGVRVPWFRGYAATMEEVSRPVDVGQIQLTPDGTAIILGPDGPTVGGYPLVGTVCPAHLARVAQWTAGLAITLTDRPPTEDRYLAQLRLGIG
jgi:allophanate hydrolase subunit 2